MEWFNGWFQPRLLQRRYTRVQALQRELQRLQTTVNAHGFAVFSGAWAGVTPDQYRRKQKLQKLPARFVISLDPLPIAAGRVTLVRQVTHHGNIHLLGLTFQVGKRRKGQSQFLRRRPS